MIGKTRLLREKESIPATTERKCLFRPRHVRVSKSLSIPTLRLLNSCLLKAFNVLTERFMQDVVEDYFGHQRAKCGRSDNPTAQQFGYNDLTIAAQRDIAPVVRGNVGGRYTKEKWYTVSDEPVHKRKKQK